jgi:Cof subfamily protein (haloacid dehalogenase superfamily)
LKYKLIVSDLDDTLLHDDQSISERTRRAIALAQARGIRFMIATGRMFPSALPFARELGLTGPIICCQGAQIADLETGRSLREAAVPIEAAREVLRFLDGEGLYAQYYSTEDYFFEKECEQTALYHRLSGVKGRALGRKPAEALDFEPIKLLSIADPALIRQTYEKAAERFGGSLTVTISRSNYLEFSHPEAHKGAAVATVAEQLGLKAHEVMACGDAMNDLSMLRWAGLGVAVANGNDDVKARADAVTASNEGDGVALAMEQYALTE